MKPYSKDLRLRVLAAVDGGYRPKASRAAVTEDMDSVSWESPTAAEMGGIGCPVALVRATQGASSGSAIPSYPTTPETP
ncbi:MAG: hypothetical protein M3N18_01900 [Actinomycetota bacterium]|nr:hypothetical protein [Actinomycetota bacterium]